MNLLPVCDQSRELRRAFTPSGLFGSCGTVGLVLMESGGHLRNL
jgi:hypothetical protein